MQCNRGLGEVPCLDKDVTVVRLGQVRGGGGQVEARARVVAGVHMFSKQIQLINLCAALFVNTCDI